MVALATAAVGEDRLAAVGVADVGEPAGDLGDGGVPVDGFERPVGTAADCDIVIEDGFMSHRHCEIRKVEGGFKLVDLGATNGVIVNDKRIKEHFLVDNDNFRLGRTEFKFKSIFG